MFFNKYCEISKSTYSHEHLRTAASAIAKKSKNLDLIFYEKFLMKTRGKYFKLKETAGADTTSNREIEECPYK